MWAQGIFAILCVISFISFCICTGIYLFWHNTDKVAIAVYGSAILVGATSITINIL
ncbi:hypothetical protein ICC_06546 [Bacillus cereus BAG1X1-1]|nr:hypothetical protein ICC_06546 [Bacillus cereus BAG1X1-1]EOO42463.1 hypothetical protein ICI_06511 [Bacillus cereus BAG1X2-1]EOO43783.1 hypothetical protein ICK_06684 [Bacillus cereus BAG1X2-2]EOP00487.1 hypothetical protein ICO_06189 [Bacillus cereus BAG2O-1]